MIIIKIKKTNDLFDQINITGHADYEIKGKDIVCASISSIVTTTVNGILSFDKTIKYLPKKDNFEIVVLRKDEITMKLLKNMIDLLEELEISYPRNVKILREE